MMRGIGVGHGLSRLLGREEEIDDVRKLLDADETRLLTLTGPGGTGKTRLALEVATQIADDYAHGVCFVPLAAVRDPQLVGSAVAQALGIRESGDRSASALVMALLREKHLLLVLDNLEHVLEAAALWMVDLLSACPRRQATIPSRAPGVRIRSSEIVRSTARQKR